MHRETDELVAGGYDAVADAYAELEGEPEWPRLRRLRGLLRRLQPGARVLDLGCGSGVPARQAIVEAGHAAVGVYVSREQVERARRNVPAAEVIHASLLDVDFAQDWRRRRVARRADVLQPARSGDKRAPCAGGRVRDR